MMMQNSFKCLQLKSSKNHFNEVLFLFIRLGLKICAFSLVNLKSYPGIYLLYFNSYPENQYPNSQAFPSHSQFQQSPPQYHHQERYQESYQQSSPNRSECTSYPADTSPSLADVSSFPANTSPSLAGTVDQELSTCQR